ncbi:hypothetical protein LVD15_00260 [Fulvivirga maritima]|uniref:hypothetical protein n=1 Tax=Fulvivirga maritima TaxID=2904247 RepID=UPI001F2EB9E6|nr:hypothetical protein [Fulvivirga maritima]UII26904.1 hypothetical protein LVD15_00260 [Fulvivirga maritima]
MMNNIKNFLFGNKHSSVVSDIGEFKSRFKERSNFICWEYEHFYPESAHPTFITVSGDKNGPNQSKLNLIRPFIKERDRINALINTKLKGNVLSNLEFEQRWNNWENRFRIITIESFFEDPLVIEFYIHSNTDNRQLHVDFRNGVISKFEIHE